MVKVYTEASLWSHSVRWRKKVNSSDILKDRGLAGIRTAAAPASSGRQYPLQLCCERASESLNWKLMLLLMIKTQVKFYGYLAVMEFPISSSLCLALTSLSWLLQGSTVPTILSVSCAQVSIMHSSMITFC